jgi:hypothetical protein
MRTRNRAWLALPVVLLLWAPQRAPALPATAPSVAEEHSHGPDGLELDPRGRGRIPVSFAVDDVLTPTWSATEYDGQVNEANIADLTTLPKVHLVYVHPSDAGSDAASRFAKFAAMFQADARAASQLLGSLYARGIRLDERPHSSVAGTTVADITIVKSAYTSRQLATSRQFTYVHNDLERVFPTASFPGMKFVAWLDAGSRYCGQGHLYQDTRREAQNDSDNKRTTGIVYRPYDASGPDGGFCRGRTFLHELGHNLGAVQKVAPHAFDGAHCNDDKNDAMCYTKESAFDSGSPQFDYKHDDYWDPGATASGNPSSPAEKLKWWAVNLSRFVCPVDSCTSANTSPGY